MHVTASHLPIIVVISSARYIMDPESLRRESPTESVTKPQAKPTLNQLTILG